MSNLKTWCCRGLLPIFCLLSSLKAFGVELRGFGTAGIQGAQSDYVIPDFGIDNNALNASYLTKFGLNFRSELSDNVSFAAQVVAAQQGAYFAPEMTWAMLSYEVSPGVELRAGRVIAPVWLYSQQIDVGFSLPWISPPREVYWLNPIQSINGASFLGKGRLGPGVLEFELVGGSGDSVTSEIAKRGYEATSVVRLQDALGVNLTYSLTGNATLRASYVRSRTDIDVTSRFYNSPTTFVGVTTPLDASLGEFYSVGGKFELGRFELLGEWADREVKGTSLPSSKAFYSTLVCRTDPWVVHATFSKLYKNTGTFRPHPRVTSGVTALLDSEDSIIVGLNYQFDEALIFKVDASLNRAMFSDASANYRQYIYHLGLDFVF